MKDWIRLGGIFINLNQVRVAVEESGSLFLHLGIDSVGDPIKLSGEDAEKVIVILKQRSQEIYKSPPKVKVEHTRPKGFGQEGRV